MHTRKPPRAPLARNLCSQSRFYAASQDSHLKTVNSVHAMQVLVLIGIVMCARTRSQGLVCPPSCIARAELCLLTEMATLLEVPKPAAIFWKPESKHRPSSKLLTNDSPLSGLCLATKKCILRPTHNNHFDIESPVQLKWESKVCCDGEHGNRLKGSANAVPSRLENSQTLKR
eukprot:3408367-Amphidinium_carterae.1